MNDICRDIFFCNECNSEIDSQNNNMIYCWRCNSFWCGNECAIEDEALEVPLPDEKFIVGGRIIQCVPCQKGKLDLSRLDITHNRLRNKAAIEEMANYIMSGGRWDEAKLKAYAEEHNSTRVSPVIQISRFDDGKLFIHDGHHRVASIFLAGRTFLYPEEFKITDWTYQSYFEISHENSWYTPFDPRTHCRAPDFAAFKKEARQRYLNGENPQAIKMWIWGNPQLYCEEREAFTISDLIENVFGVLP